MIAVLLFVAALLAVAAYGGHLERQHHDARCLAVAAAGLAVAALALGLSR